MGVLNKKIFLALFYFFKYKPIRKWLLRRIANSEGGFMYSETIRSIYENEYKISIGYGSYGGCFDIDNIPAGVKFGNYCSVSKEIRVFRANHPRNTFTSHPLLYNPIAGYVQKDALVRPGLEIGHDVWIGEWVIILPGVTSIGNGAIIGAGSIVTKNVLPYTIVVGNPAKAIATRFDEDTINKLEESKWWEMRKEELVAKMDFLNNLIKN